MCKYKNQNQIVEQKYYGIVAARYGADVAMLTKLRFNEMHRAVSEALEDRKQHNTVEGAALPKDIVVATFLEQLAAVLKNDYLLGNMLAKDADVRAWVALVAASRG